MVELVVVSLCIMVLGLTVQMFVLSYYQDYLCERMNEIIERVNQHSDTLATVTQEPENEAKDCPGHFYISTSGSSDPARQDIYEVKQ